MTSTTSRTRLGHLARARLLAPAACAALVLGLTAAPAGAEQRAHGAVLTTGTSITWTGTKGFLLRVPAYTTIPTYGARLFLRGGSYAFVRYRLERPGCFRDICAPDGYLDYSRAAAPMYDATDGPGTEHWARIGFEYELRAGTYEVYLFTDGEATLTFDRTDLPLARRTYRPTGRISGGAAELPVTCAAAACDPATGYAGRVRAGGRQVDVGKLGAVTVTVSSVDHAHPPTWQYPQSHAVRACVHPRYPGEPLSADPADYPWGCPMSGEDADDTAFYAGSTVNTMFGGVPVYDGYATMDANPRASGKVYAGYQAMTAHDVSSPMVSAYVVWFTYGVR